jgi:hypothetical protein
MCWPAVFPAFGVVSDVAGLLSVFSRAEELSINSRRRGSLLNCLCPFSLCNADASGPPGRSCRGHPETTWDCHLDPTASCNCISWRSTTQHFWPVRERPTNPYSWMCRFNKSSDTFSAVRWRFGIPPISVRSNRAPSLAIFQKFLFSCCKIEFVLW